MASWFEFWGAFFNVLRMWARVLPPFVPVISHPNVSLIDRLLFIMLIACMFLLLSYYAVLLFKVVAAMNSSNPSPTKRNVP